LYSGAENGGWTLELHDGPDGLIHLPPLAPGKYVFGAGVRADRLPDTQGVEGTPSDVLTLLEIPREGRFSDAPRRSGC